MRHGASEPRTWNKAAPESRLAAFVLRRSLALGELEGGAGAGLAGLLALDDAGVAAHARERLAGYKIPRSIDWLEELPKTGSGKVILIFHCANC